MNEYARTLSKTGAVSCHCRSKNPEELEAAINSESEVIFILQSHLMELSELSKK